MTTDQQTPLRVALLGGADENELDREAEDNPGAVHTRLSALFRRGPARAAEIAQKMEEHIKAHTPWGAKVEVEVVAVQG